MARELRDYQREDIAAVHAEWDRGIVRTAGVAATGLGKTSIIGALATEEVQRGGRVLIVAHRFELLGQIKSTCQAFDPSIPVGWVQGARSETRRPITVGMVQTLGNAGRRRRMLRPTLVIVDEAHRTPARSYRDILEWAGCFPDAATGAPATCRLVGVTATFIRGDKLGLGDIYQSVAFNRDIRWGVQHGPVTADGLTSGPIEPGEAGWLVPPKGRVIVAKHMDLSKAKTSAGDYQNAELGEMISRDAAQIVDDWRTHAGELCTVVFAPSVASARDLLGEFVRVGVAAEIVLGTTSTTDRIDIYKRLSVGDTQVLINVGVATEGFDEPRIQCVVMARPTKLPGLYVQCIGRGLRRAPGKAWCLVLDVCGVSRKQKLQTLVDLSLTVEYDRDELDAIPCPECGGYVPRRGDDVEDAPPPALDDWCYCTKPERAPAEAKPVLLGPARYEDIDLFAGSTADWKWTRGGLRFLRVDGMVATLWPHKGRSALKDDEREPYWYAHWVSLGDKRHNGQITYEGAALDDARQVAEEWAQRQAERRIPGRRRAAASAYRGTQNGKPSKLLVEEARLRGVADPESMGRVRLQHEIDVAMASAVLDPPMTAAG